MLSDNNLVSWNRAWGTKPQKNKERGRMSTTVVFVTAKSQTRHYSATNGEPLGKVWKSNR